MDFARIVENTFAPDNLFENNFPFGGFDDVMTTGFMRMCRTLMPNQRVQICEHIYQSAMNHNVCPLFGLLRYYECFAIVFHHDDENAIRNALQHILELANLAYNNNVDVNNIAFHADEFTELYDNIIVEIFQRQVENIEVLNVRNACDLVRNMFDE